MPDARLGAIIAGAFFSFITSAALFACLLVFLASCAALGFMLYGSAHVLAYAFGIEFRWSLVIACWILLIGAPAGAFVHDWRMHRRLALRRSIPATDL